ncbi:unnamed protein product [Prunus armeniaca]
MAQDHDLHSQNQRLVRRGFPLRRGRKLPVARLGGPKPKRGLVFVKMLKRIRMRWLKLQYLCMLKKLKGVLQEHDEGLNDSWRELGDLPPEDFHGDFFRHPNGSLSFQLPFCCWIRSASNPFHVEKVLVLFVKSHQL